MATTATGAAGSFTGMGTKCQSTPPAPAMPSNTALQLRFGGQDAFRRRRLGGAALPVTRHGGRPEYPSQKEVNRFPKPNAECLKA